MSHPSIAAVNARFAARLRAGETLLGSIIALPCAEVAELFSRAGFDWLCIDTEHAPLDPLAAQTLLQAARCPCLVRVPVGEEAVIKKVLDIGAAGVIVPQVNTAATAEGMKPYIQKGYTLPIAGMDLMLLSAAVRGVVQALK